MKKALIAVTAAAVALVAAPAIAQDGTQWYGSLGYSHYDTDFDADLGAVNGRIGARFGRHLGVEGEAAFGVKDDSGVELNHSVALYGVAFLPVSDQFDLLARVGFGNTEVEVGGVDFDDDSVNYGIGAQWNFDEANAIRGDWTKIDSDTAEADVFSLNYVRKF